MDEQDKKDIAKYLAEQLRKECAWPCNLTPDILVDLLEMREVYNRGKRGIAWSMWQLLKAGLLAIVVFGLLGKLLRIEGLREMLRRYL